MPGPPLVVDGHRLLARLFHAFDAHGGWNRTTGGGGAGGGDGAVVGGGAVGSGGAGGVERARFMMALLTERASMDSFQVAYAEPSPSPSPSPSP